MTRITEKTVANIKNEKIKRLLEVGNDYGREMHLIYIDSSICQIAEYIVKLEDDFAAKTSA